MDERDTIRRLVEELNAASEAYYGGREEIMSNFEWDAKFDELQRLEELTGFVLPESPTRRVSDSEEQSGGQKEPHEYPALSLAKTKKLEDLLKWAGELPVWLSWKLDGLTLVLTYDNGVLAKILTRGNGTVGTNITYMKDVIRGFPKKIDYRGHLVVRGEATISYTDFEAINDSMDDEDEKFANPRNLASGTLALDAKNLDKVAERKLCFNAFTLVHTDEELVSWGARMDLLDSMGFTTVERERTDAARLPDAIERWTEKVESGKMDIPVDGLVITYDDTDYAATGSVTGHHATRAGYAFKWQDSSAVSMLDHVEWSCAASTITPVAVFEPVKLEGTTVSRASLCNISEMERLGIGENGKTKLQIIKANKIIPKCVAVISREGTFAIPDRCPVCGADTAVVESRSGTKTLKCLNPACPAKDLKKFARFVGRDGMDIDGLSIETLRDFVNERFLSDFADIYRLSEHVDRIETMDGYGKKSADNLMKAIEKSRSVHPAKLIVALCIPLIGGDAAKRMIAACGWKGFLTRLEDGTGFEDIDGIGGERSRAVVQWYAEPSNRAVFEKLLAELNVEDVEPKAASGGSCAGKVFVITGDVAVFRNRDEFKAYVESQGGKVTGSVSKKTDYLVNNDPASGSSKNVKAAQLGVPLISEEEFISLFGGP
ncbi:MAG: NAD-dependent DNA ligase LigA [Oscillospiraceae bacterium]|nr:NAD-dependent DNA ligase LigA [Oscillospiraceae bacterium]